MVYTDFDDISDDDRAHWSAGRVGGTERAVSYLARRSVRLVLLAGLIVLFLKGSEYVTEFFPDFNRWVDMFLLAVVVAVLLYGVFRTIDLIRGLVRG